MVPEKTRKMAYLKLLGLGAVILGILTVLFSQYTASWSIPDPIYNIYRKEESLFTLTWFENPFDGYSIYARLQVDGTTLERTLVSGRSHKGSWPGQLTVKQNTEIQKLLELLRHSTTYDPFAGSRVITLSFTWQGEHYIKSFNETNCPEEVQRLLEIANTTWEGAESNLCQKPVTYNHTPLETTPPLANATSHYSKFPDLVKRLHGSHLFTIMWFKQPFTGSYEKLSLVIDDHMSDDFLLYQNKREPSDYSALNTEEIQEMKELVSSLSNIMPSRGTSKENSTIITLGFPWEIDYHLLTFDTESCPDELQRLLEMSEDIMKRDAPGWEAFDNPCQGE